MSALAAEQTSQGTQAGEPAQPEAVESVAASEAPVTETATEPTPAVDWAKVDLESLPKDFLAKVEQAKFKSMDAAFTRKAQELARDRELVEKLISRIAPEQAADPKQDTLKKLREGDFDAIPAIPDLLEQELRPFKQQMALQQAVQVAEARHPYVRERAQEIAQVLASNPELQNWAFSDPARNLPYTLEALAISIQSNERQAQIESMQKDFDARVEAKAKELFAKGQERARAIPSKTSLAGTTPTASPGSGNEDLTMKQRAVKWLESQGVQVDPALREQAARGI